MPHDSRFVVGAGGFFSSLVDTKLEWELTRGERLSGILTIALLRGDKATAYRVDCYLNDPHGDQFHLAGFNESGVFGSARDIVELERAVSFVPEISGTHMYFVVLNDTEAFPAPFTVRFKT